MTAENWGCPDWRDKDAYPDVNAPTDGLELEQWQWQFMRRHPKYREIAARGEQVELEARYSENQKSFTYLLFKPINEDRETLQKLFRIYSKTAPYPTESVLLTSDAPYWLGDLMPLPIAFGGINPGLIDIPNGLEINNKDTGEVDWHETEKTRREVFEKHVGRLYKAIEKGRCSLVFFDHTKSLDRQIKKVRIALAERHDAFRDQRKSFTLDMKYWPRHLRVIDAKDQGATHDKIFGYFAEEKTNGDDDALDKFYRNHNQPRSEVSQWHSQAIKVMEKAKHLL